MEKVFVSIVAPVYNVGLYLSSFIDSVLEQTLTDWELILVDDGSSDGSGAICDEYSRKDERIRVIHKKNGGVSSARNAGIKECNGTWLLLPDADDYLFSDALQVLSSYVGDDVDLVSAGYVRNVLGRIVPESKQSITNKLSVIRYIDEIGVYPQARNMDRYCWNKLFRLSVIKEHSVLFDESIFYREDILYIYQYLSKCTGFVQSVSYNMSVYYMRDSGAAISLQKSYSRKSGGKFLAMTKCYDTLELMDAPVDVKSRMKNEILSAFKSVIKLINDTGVGKGDVRMYYLVLLQYFSRWDLFKIGMRRLFHRLRRGFSALSF